MSGVPTCTSTAPRADRVPDALMEALADAAEERGYYTLGDATR